MALGILVSDVVGPSTAGWLEVLFLLPVTPFVVLSWREGKENCFQINTIYTHRKVGKNKRIEPLLHCCHLATNQSRNPLKQP